ncbi:MAG TPA: AAA family ATPase [Mycobacterium sp.]|nr:AAA family ATPase [Mycobacterium sp.]
MLIDRVDERAILEDLVDAACRGASRALVLHGEAGMGKTALLDYAASLQSGLRLLRISGVEAESQFGFAALHRLVLPFLADLDLLPTPQRDALRSAFGLATHSPADLFLVGLATLTLLAEVASSGGGMLCIADDVQWIDQESLEALAFVGRRLDADGIGLLLGIRTSAETPLGLAGLQSLEIVGLPKDSALELLSLSASGPLDAQVAQRIVSETSGCPLALIELAQDITAEQRVGADQLTDPIPISRRLEAHFRRQVDSLPPEVQTFLLVTALEASGDPPLIRRVARELGCLGDPERLAVRENLIATGQRIEFRHPLIRSAIYAGADPAHRRKVHEALAHSIDRAAYPDRWARHVTATAIGYDSQLAADLETMAEQARGRGGFTAEASLLVQAADLTEGPGLRSTRLLAAATAATAAGAPHQAEMLLSQARPGLSDDLLIAEAIRLGGRLRIPLGQPAAAPALLLAAARQFLPLDIDSARDSLLEAFDAYAISQHLTLEIDGREIAQTALAMPAARSDYPRLSDRMLDGTARLLALGYSAAVSDFLAATQILRDGPNGTEDFTRWTTYGMWVANELFDDRTYAAWVERVENATRAQGALMALLFTLIAAAAHQIRAGNFSGAEAHYAEALELAAAIGQPTDPYRPVNVTLLAWQGNEAGTRAAAETLIDVGTAIGSAVVVYLAQNALAIFALGAGRYADALVAGEYITRREAIGWTSQTLPLVVEAGVRSGNHVAAERALADLATRAEASGTPWARGLLARSQALMAPDHEAESLFTRAIEFLDQTLVQTDLAVAHLLYGEWLRRQNRRVDARTELRMAYEAFASMGALGFADRAHSELLATGARARRRSVETKNELTAQELQISRLASRGATNPEIAAKLFLSSSTVDYHLRKVFRKLSITSRRQLERHLPQ